MGAWGNRSGRILLAALGFGLLGWRLAPFWMYVVLGSTTAGIGWTVWVLVRESSRHRAATGAATRQRPLDLPSADQYREFLPVEAAAFEGQAQIQVAAARVFGAWVRQLPMAPRDPSVLIRSVHLETRHIGRLTSTIVKRTLAWREATLPGRSAVTRPTVTIETVDPWATTPEDLRTASRYVASCGHCAGQGNVTCPACNGSTRAKCSVCDGTGKAYGYAVNGSRRLMNCKSCHAKGEVDCEVCTKGKATCSPCQGAGTVARWIEIAEASRIDMELERDPEAERVFGWHAAHNQTAVQIERDAGMSAEVSSEGSLSREQVAQRVPPEWIETKWQTIQPTVGSDERVRSQTFQFLEIPAVDVSYAMGEGAAETVRLEGRRMLAPPMGAFGDRITAHAGKVRRLRAILVSLAASMPFVYALRGRYFWNGLAVATVVSVAGLAFIADRFFSAATLNRTNARRWAGAVIVGLTLACGMAAAVEPSLGAARRHLARGRIERARDELLALGKAGETRGAPVWADLHLAEVLQANDAGAIADLAVKIPDSSLQRETANRHLLDVANGAVLQYVSNRQTAAAHAVLAQVTPVLQAGPQAQVLSVRVAELRARVRDEEYDECSADICRWRAALAAMRATPSGAREQRLVGIRARLIEGLTFQEQLGQPAISRLERLGAILALASSVEEARQDDDLTARARLAAATAADERAKVPVLSAQRAIAAELLGVRNDPSTAMFQTVISAVAVYASIRGERCTGLYLVGNEKGARVLNDAGHRDTTTRLISQALGRKVTMPQPPAAGAGKVPTTSRWTVAGTPIVARWRDADLIELRIGEVKL